MKKMRYTAGLKMLILVLQQLFSIILVVSIVLLCTLFGKKMLDTNNLWNKSFTDSGYYAEVFQETANDVLDYAALKEQFETNGAYDEDKKIDIIAYVNGHVQGDNKNANIDPDEERIRMEYKLNDLIDWANSGYTMGEDGLIQETYATVSGNAIHTYYNNGSMEWEEAYRLSHILEETLNNINADITRYKRYLNKYDSDKTNVSYWICTGIDHKTYSNITEEEAQDKIARITDKKEKSYFYYNDTNLRLDTSVKAMEDYYYNNLNRMALEVGNNPIILITVDTSFSKQDDFWQAKVDFDKYHPWIIIGIILLALSAVAWIITLVLLTTMAGKSSADDMEIRLNFVDKIKTEFIFILLIAFVIAMTVVSVKLIYTTWKIPGMLIMAGTMAYICNSVFLIFYLSIIRRMKAERLWKNSFLYWLITGIHKVVFHWKISFRLIITFIVGNIVFLAIAYGMFVKRNILALACWCVLVGANGVFMLKEAIQRNKILDGVNEIAGGDLKYKIDDTDYYGSNKQLAQAINNIGDGLYCAVDENTKNERMKADLITNVSHDIKTPLTSIINYVNLIKMENIQDDKLKGYVDILDTKAQRLRQLTEDLVEASKISSGNIELHMECINFVELVYQTGGEFNEKFEAKDLTTVTKLPNEPVMIMVDGRRIWRVVENLYNNVAKYALAHTRVYVEMVLMDTEVEFSIKNISELELKVDTNELTERFIRGDVARTTEGSGLGLSIAKNLTVLMNGKFDIDLDGDLFKASITFPLVKKEALTGKENLPI